MYRILIADDEPVIRKGLQKLIEQSGQPIASLRLAEHGCDALQQIREERPHFLFTDIRMPKMDGLELCRRTAEWDSDIQIVVVSGYNDFEYAQKCLSYGVKEYLLKPISKKSVEAALEKLAKAYAKQASQPFVSVSRLEQWVSAAEEAVWNLQHDRLLEIIGFVRQELASCGLKLYQTIEVLAEFSALLIKRLNVRDVFVFTDKLRLDQVQSESEAVSLFQSDLELMLQELKARRRGKLRDHVEEAKLYIEEHLNEEVSLEEVADRIGLNPSYFSQLFKQSTQETFVQYRTRRRMEKAKKLLALPHYRITDISGEVGYADHPHFTKTFKKYTGELPSEYRSRLGID
ncbi:response regulator [Paenibacillus doosanensis]|uniref:Response regulatory protein n=1 Tax=Paenibacillus konkukensis TaxID=2020716 RepID=A0ABY4RWV2_9BACL|nr:MULTISPECIES: response regulator [Paenibacillus]MCS7459381.1 response regulator [Paenibacillus doosanensis]UQZ87174.1 putative response regulatory protein [Paenibacillus konkukensis]